MDGKSRDEIFYEHCFRGDLEFIRGMVDEIHVHPFDVNWRKEPHLLTPLYVACQAGHLGVVEYLLTVPKLDPTIPSKTGVTPLSKACTEGMASCVKVLMKDPRVNVNQPQETGSTPLFMACQNGFPTVVELLIKDSRVEINKMRNDNTTPFYKACEKGHLEVVRVILKSGLAFDLNAPAMGVTPFYLACEKGHKDMVALMLTDYRIDITIPKDDGATPIFVTAQNGHFACAELILASGRPCDHKKKARFNNNSSAEQGRAMAQRQKRPEESEADHQRKRIEGPRVAGLIDAFDKDPVRVRAALCAKHNLPYYSSTMNPDIMLPALPPQLPPMPLVEYATALSNYDAGHHDQLSFKGGDVFKIISKHESGWWMAQLGEKQGLVPRTYLIPSSASQAPPPPVTPAAVAVAAKTRTALVEYDSQKTKVVVSLTSVADLISTFQSKFSIKGPIILECKDEDMDEFYTVKDLEALPEKPRFRILIPSSNWWNWAVDSSWMVVNGSVMRSQVIMESGSVYHPGAMEKFKLVATGLGFSVADVKKVYAVSSTSLLTLFDGYRDTLFGKHRANPQLFRREDWIQRDNPAARATYLGRQAALSSLFPWNDGSKARVIPQLHQHVTEETVWKICQHGVNTNTPDGNYGAGTYFTSSMAYAERHQNPNDHQKPFLVSMVIPGNSYPATEAPFNERGEVNPDGLKAKPCRVGYQSHLTLVKMDDPESPVITNMGDAEHIVDELVTFDLGQVLPMFVFYK